MLLERKTFFFFKRLEERALLFFFLAGGAPKGAPKGEITNNAAGDFVVSRLGIAVTSMYTIVASGSNERGATSFYLP